MMHIKIKLDHQLLFASPNYLAVKILFADFKNITAQIQNAAIKNVSHTLANAKPVHPAAKKQLNYGYRNKTIYYQTHHGSTLLLQCHLSFGISFGIIENYLIKSV